MALRILLARVCAALDFSPAASPAAAAGGGQTETGVGVEEATAPAAEGGTVVEARDGFRGREEALSGSTGGDVTAPLVGGGASSEGWRGVVGGGGGGGGESPGGGGKEMQAGFTVLPGGGVHLRLRKWK